MGLRNGLYQFDNLSQFPSLYHVITTKKFPSVKSTSGGIHHTNLKKILNGLYILSSKFVLLEQVHGAYVALVSKSREKLIKGADGMIITQKMYYGGIVTADCLPIIMFDSEKNFVALMHAGYKGLLANILQETIHLLTSLGSRMNTVYVGIGPGIGVCCYNVQKERVEQFSHIIPNHKNFFTIKEKHIFLDLKRVAFLQLTDAGIRREQIEIAPYCTRTNNDLFFSYRAEGEGFGEFITLAGLV